MDPMTRNHPTFQSTVREVLTHAIGMRSSASEWLRLDERGTWERQAASYIEEKYDLGVTLGLTHQQIVAEIGERLVLVALQAMLAHAQKTAATKAAQKAADAAWASQKAAARKRTKV